MQPFVFAFLMFAMLTMLANAQEQQPGWVLRERDGVPIASYNAADGSTLLSAGCDSATGELVLYRATRSAMETGRLTIIMATGSRALQASTATQESPGVIARTPADPTLAAEMATAATITFQFPDEAPAGGLAVPVGTELRQIVDSCASSR